MSLRDEGICMGFPMLCQGTVDLGTSASSLLVSWLLSCGSEHTEAAKIIPRFWVWDLFSALFRNQVTLQLISLPSFPTGAVSSLLENLYLSPGFLIHGVGGYFISDPKLAATQGSATCEALCCIRWWMGGFVDSLLAKAPLNLLPILWEAHMVAGLKETSNFRFVLHPTDWVLGSSWHLKQPALLQYEAVISSRKDGSKEPAQPNGQFPFFMLNEFTVFFGGHSTSYSLISLLSC